jgi:hypothetical protein
MTLNSFKRKCASTPVSDGMSSISQCISPDGLRRSAFNSTPFGVASVLPQTGSIRRLASDDESRPSPHKKSY